LPFVPHLLNELGGRAFDEYLVDRVSRVIKEGALFEGVSASADATLDDDAILEGVRNGRGIGSHTHVPDDDGIGAASRDEQILGEDALLIGVAAAVQAVFAIIRLFVLLLRLPVGGGIVHFTLFLNRLGVALMADGSHGHRVLSLLNGRLSAATGATLAVAIQAGLARQADHVAVDGDGYGGDGYGGVPFVRDFFLFLWNAVDLRRSLSD